MTTWDDTFESLPTNAEDASDGAARIRTLKTAISEREDGEHNFKKGTKPFHKPGKCAVMYKGTTAQITALEALGVSEGCIVYDTDLSVIKVYRAGTGWQTLAISHSSLSDLDDEEHTLDPHPHYLKLNKESQEITQNLACGDNVTIDGRDVDIDGDINDIIETSRGFGDWSSIAVTASSGTLTPDSPNRNIDRFICLKCRRTSYSSDPSYLSARIILSSVTVVVDGYAWHADDSYYSTLCFPVPRGWAWEVKYQKFTVFDAYRMEVS